MRVLFIGDIFSTPGVKVMQDFLRAFRDDYDFVIANGENVAGGAGLTRKHFKQMLDAGVDVVTLGNHAWDKREALELVEETPRLLRPLNYPPGTPGLGHASYEARNGERVTVAQAMGRIFLDPLDCPFRAVDGVLETRPANEPLILDFHAEATSEKRAMGYHLRGRAAAMVGTHTHVQTADERVTNGTATITDVGMTGVQDSAIGMRFEEVHYRFTTRLPQRYKPAEGSGEVRAVSLELSGNRATKIERIQWATP